MKISIITATFNSSKTIADTIQSVNNQSYANIEHIFIDGGSLDSTLDIVEKKSRREKIIVSETDNGIYDAMNKGINVSSGDIIGFLHSDDIFASSDSVNKIVKKFSKTNTDSVYGDLVYTKNNNVIRKWTSGSYNKQNFKLGWMPPHPTLYIKKDTYRRYGMYRTDFSTSADYELIIKFLYLNNVSSSYIPSVLVNMNIGGASNRNIYSRIRAHYYDWKAWNVNKISRFPIWVFLKPFRKIGQYLL